jgi:ubiquinone/menaquinone biosynthesis C-methylase UbiE
MHERRYSAAIERLRAPERVARIELERVTTLSLEGVMAESVMDIGTGSGLFAEVFAGRGLAVTGVDTNPEMLAAAREFVPDGDFVQGSLEELPFDDASFDLVFLGHVLHEADDLLHALAEVKRCARLRVAILEWPYQEEEHGPPQHHRLQPDDILLAASAVGFSRIEWITLEHMEYYRLGITEHSGPHS